MLTLGYLLSSPALAIPTLGILGTVGAVGQPVVDVENSILLVIRQLTDRS